jgi:hypothetical protein
MNSLDLEVAAVPKDPPGAMSSHKLLLSGLQK